VGGKLIIEWGTSNITKFVGRIPWIGDDLEDLADWLAEANLFAEIAGRFSVEAKVQRETPDEALFASPKGGGITGSMIGELGLRGHSIGKRILDVTLSGYAEVAASGTLMFDEEGVLLAGVKLEFKGLQGRIKFKVLKVWEIRESVTFIDAETLAGPEDVRVWTFD
jgi:hypothetical protein